MSDESPDTRRGWTAAEISAAIMRKYGLPRPLPPVRDFVDVTMNGRTVRLRKTDFGVDPSTRILDRELREQRLAEALERRR